MKKNLVLLGIAFVMLFSLAACGEKEDNMELSVELQTQIKQDYATANGMSVDDVIIHGYYGTYGNRVVLSLGDMASVIIDVFGGTETVAGKTFTYAQPGYRIVVWHEGNFYSLTEQHEQGLLTNGNIEKIWNLYQK